MLYSLGLLIQISAQLSRPQAFVPAEEGKKEIGSPEVPPTPQATYFSSIIAERNAAKNRVSSFEDSFEKKESEPVTTVRDEPLETAAHLASKPDVVEKKHEPARWDQESSQSASKPAMSKNPDEIDMDYINQLIEEISEKKS